MSARGKAEKHGGDFKNFREQEVEVLKYYGFRFEDSFLFLTLTDFQEEFGSSALELVPESVISQRDHLGNEVQGVVVQDESKKKPYKRIIGFSEEVHVHKARLQHMSFGIIFLFSLITHQFDLTRLDSTDQYLQAAMTMP